MLQSIVQNTHVHARLPLALLPHSLPAWLILTLTTIAVTALIALLTLYFTAPHVLLQILNHCIDYYSGMRSHTVTVTDSESGERIRYHSLIGGRSSSPSIVLFHGFGMDASSWSIIAATLLANNYRVIVPDIPGFGRTVPLSGELRDFSFSAQSKRLHTFINSLVPSTEKYHIGGTSMGGGIATVYAAVYTEEVASLWLLCPAGIRGAETTKFCESLSSSQSRVENNILLSHTTSDMIEVFHHLFYKPPYVPAGVFRAWAYEKSRRLPVQTLAMAQLTSDEQVLAPHHSLPLITAPTCVGWGKHDEILHCSAVDVIQEKMTAKPDVILVESGHAITVEQSNRITEHYLKFLDKLNAKLVRQSSKPLLQPMVEPKQPKRSPSPVPQAVVDSKLEHIETESEKSVMAVTNNKEDEDVLTNDAETKDAYSTESPELDVLHNANVKNSKSEPNLAKTLADAAGIKPG